MVYFSTSFLCYKKYGIRATCFLTNPIEIEIPSNLEIGIHPDFRSPSPQGSDYRNIIDQMLTWFPEACGVRNHRWHWDYCRKVEISKPLFGIRNPIFSKNRISRWLGNFRPPALWSFFLPFHPRLLPTKAYGKFVRFPVWWTDNLHLAQGFALDRISIPILTCFQKE